MTVRSDPDKVQVQVHAATVGQTHSIRYRRLSRLCAGPEGDAYGLTSERKIGDCMLLRFAVFGRDATMPINRIGSCRHPQCPSEVGSRSTESVTPHERERQDAWWKLPFQPVGALVPELWMHRPPAAIS